MAGPAEPRLPDLERRFRETGDEGDERRLLAGRLRAGELAADDLRLAAYLGHGAARAALGADAPEAVADTFAWVVGLGAWGKAAAVRAAIAVGELARPLWERAVSALAERDDAAMEDPRAALEAAVAWVRCPCRAHEEQAERAAERAFVVPQRTNELPYATWPGAALTEAAWAAAVADRAKWLPAIDPARLDAAQRSARERHGAAVRGDAPAAAASAARCAALLLVRSGEAHDAAEAGARVRAAIRDALVPWALGHAER